jgi:hypothetical protein
VRDEEGTDATKVAELSEIVKRLQTENINQAETIASLEKQVKYAGKGNGPVYDVKAVLFKSHNAPTES